MKKNALLCLIISFFLNLHLSAAVSNEKYFSELFFQLSENSVSQQTILAGSLLALTALPFDRTINKKMTEDRLLSAEWTHYGHAYLDNFFVLALLGGGALLKGNESGDYLTPVRYGASSLMITTGATLLLKKVTGRQRPNGKPYSFPSGHTSITFCTASVLHSWYGPKAAIPAYSAAAFTAFSRMQDNYHWLSDVIFGAALGIAIPHGLYQADKTNSKTTLRSIPLSINWTIDL
ncbi:MAG TPA: phosphatase PAP2 family protein [Candidatus Marinimicrobia bacterium]|nr:phosphatase PAP2 family protein [Candidatus Neomarinimicrobiota bacterium]